MCPCNGVVQASASSSVYEGQGRLQLVKQCRERNIAYQAVAKDIGALKKLLVADDNK